MPDSLKPLLIACLAALAAPEAPAICKWTDASGVVHYAETCPEDVEAKPVPIQEPPSKEQVDVAVEGSQQLLRQTREMKDRRRLEAQQDAVAAEESLAGREADARRCAEARWVLAILAKPLPVYLDEANNLHHKRSLHDQWYQGSRAYLDDRQRAEAVLRQKQIEADACTASEADIRARIALYQEKRNQQACQYMRDRLRGMQTASSGIPSDEMRSLQKQIETHCR